MAMDSALRTAGSDRNGCGCAAVERSPSGSDDDGSVRLTWMRSTSVPKAAETLPRPAASMPAMTSGASWVFQA